MKYCGDCSKPLQGSRIPMKEPVFHGKYPRCFFFGGSASFTWKSTIRTHVPGHELLGLPLPNKWSEQFELQQGEGGSHQPGRIKHPVVHSGKLTQQWEIHHLKMYLLKNVGFPLLCWFTRGHPVFFTTILLDLKLWKNLSTLHEGFFFQVKALKKVTLEAPQKGKEWKSLTTIPFLQEFFSTRWNLIFVDFRITNPPKAMGGNEIRLGKQKKRTAKFERTVRRSAEGRLRDFIINNLCTGKQVRTNCGIYPRSKAQLTGWHCFTTGTSCTVLYSAWSYWKLRIPGCTASSLTPMKITRSLKLSYECPVGSGTVEPAVEACPARFKSRPLLPPCQGQGPHTGVLFGQNTLSDFEPWLKRRMLTATHTLIHWIHRESCFRMAYILVPIFIAASGEKSCMDLGSWQLMCTLCPWANRG